MFTYFAYFLEDKWYMETLRMVMRALIVGFAQRIGQELAALLFR